MTAIVNLILDFYAQNSGLVTLGICVFIMFVVFKMYQKGGELAQITPATSVSLGIFFTFFGLAMTLSSASGLSANSHFEVLVAGLSTAFWSSVVGILCSIIAKIFLAKSHRSSPLSEIELSLQRVREQIEGLGDDIEGKLTKPISQAIGAYVSGIQEGLDKSAKLASEMNSTYIETIKELNEVQSASSMKWRDTVLAFNGFIAESEGFSTRMKEVYVQNANLLAKQEQWVISINDSLSSISSLTPEASKVLESIEIINGYSQNFATTLKEINDDALTRFESDMGIKTSEILKTLTHFDSRYKDQISSHITKLDQTLEQTLGRITGHFGEGIVCLAERQLQVFDESIEGLAAVKNQVFDELERIRATSTNSDIQDLESIDGIG